MLNNYLAEHRIDELPSLSFMVQDTSRFTFTAPLLARSLGVLALDGLTWYYLDGFFLRHGRI